MSIERFMNKVKYLTGKKWCPYPTNEFIEICSKVNDRTFVKLIKKRRQLTAIDFLAKEDPMKNLYIKINKDEY